MTQQVCKDCSMNEVINTNGPADFTFRPVVCSFEMLKHSNHPTNGHNTQRDHC